MFYFPDRWLEGSISVLLLPYLCFIPIISFIFCLQHPFHQGYLDACSILVPDSDIWLIIMSIFTHMKAKTSFQVRYISSLSIVILFCFDRLLLYNFHTKIFQFLSSSAVGAPFLLMGSSADLYRNNYIHISMASSYITTSFFNFHITGTLKL